ncbi:protein Wnt-11b-like isoform X2 [Chiloscyllium punctatum]|uniref:protein Wnt-11b-like isoform X2 n=1 Tax=Chiloscyllium punctatum TaxID=137246 RepID=UPI003B639587
MSSAFFCKPCRLRDGTLVCSEPPRLFYLTNLKMEIRIGYLLLVFVQWRLCGAIQWLAIAVSGTAVGWNHTQHCKRPGFVPDQQQLCRRNLDLMPTIVFAAQQTRLVCQKAMADMRWNCSSIQLAPRFNPDLNRGTRESSFVYALSSAALSHSIARFCASGELPTCSCGLSPAEVPGPDFRWGGCGDNLRYGLQLGSVFADAPMKGNRGGTQANRLMNKHNNDVGRQALIDSLETKCKCHGVSGSCSVKTCWKGLQELNKIAVNLKSKYLAATRVIHRYVGTRKQLVPKELDIRPVRENELIYLVGSPDYCTASEKQGSYGTYERQCNKTSVHSDSCNLMCCGRGYNAYTETIIERCSCKYHWCCYVTCKKCERTAERGLKDS